VNRDDHIIEAIKHSTDPKQDSSHNITLNAIRKIDRRNKQSQLLIWVVVALALLMGNNKTDTPEAPMVDKEIRLLEEPDGAESSFVEHARSAIGDPNVEPWKKRLLNEGLENGWPERDCSVSLYHPKEAGWQGVGPWTRWTGTATGTLVRPGVASCGQRYRKRWLGAWIWVEGFGVQHVEDVFPSGSEYWFDIAVPAPVHKSGEPFSYQEWIDPLWIARIAYDYGKKPSTFVVLRPPRGW